MTPGFGARLRSQREQQQIPLSAIAEQTKIKASLLEGLERDDLSRWPKGIFRRAYVKSYAQAIGLDADAVVREFLELYPEPVEEDVPATLAAARGMQGRPPARLALMLGSAWSALPSRRGQGQKETPGPADGRPSATPSPRDHEGALPAEPQPEPQLMELASAASPPEQPVPLVTIEEPAPVAEPIVVDETVSPAARQTPDIDLADVAHVCTRLACAADEGELRGAVADAGRVLDALGLIVWVWNPHLGALAPGLAHGYSEDLISQLPRVRPEADNAIAAAFRAVDARVVNSGPQSTGAVVVPLTTSYGCAGVLALEMRPGAEERPSLLATARILAAQLSTLFGEIRTAQAATA